MAVNGKSGAREIRAVVLDYGEVLCHRPSDEEFGRMAKMFGADRNSFPAMWNKNRGELDRGEMSPEAYWRTMAEDAGRRIDREQLDQLCRWDLEMWARENPQMVAWLRSLRRAGIKTAILSNLHPDMLRHVQGKFGWLEEFDFKTFSADVRMTKPNPAIYEHTLRGLGVAARETIFVDDREANVQAAQELGIQAIRFRNVAQLREELAAMGFPVLPGEE